MNDLHLEVFSEWAQNVAGTLSALLGQEAQTKELIQTTLTPPEMVNYVTTDTFHLTLSLSGALVGPSLLALELGDAARVAATMLDDPEPPEELAADHRKATEEALSQIASFLSPSMEEVVADEVTVTSGEAKTGSIPELGAPGYLVVDMTFELAEDGPIKLYLFVPSGLVEELLAVAHNHGQEVPKADSSLPVAESYTRPSHDLDILGDIPVQLTAVLGKASIMVEDLLTLSRGSIVELERNISQPLELYVRDRAIAAGEVVILDERFGINIVTMLSEKKRPNIVSGP